MSDLRTLFLEASCVSNMPLTLFLRLCTFIALSRRPEAALGLGVANTDVVGVTVPLDQIIHDGRLAHGAWAWAGMPDLELS
jgi:Na+-transporting NADH:ubiquinone oxidoreductase subunit E